MYATSSANKCQRVKGIHLEPFGLNGYFIHILFYMQIIYINLGKTDKIADDIY